MTAEDWKRKSVCARVQSQRVCGDDSKLMHLEVLSDLTNEPLEGELPDEEFGGLLVLADLTESDGTGAETMGLLDATLNDQRKKESERRVRGAVSVCNARWSAGNGE